MTADNSTEDKTPVYIIGVGNPYRGDDAVGLFIAKQLKDASPVGVEVFENYGEAATMIELMEEAEAVIFIDAVQSNSEPGRIIRIDVSREGIPPGKFRYSTHAFSIPEAIGLARQLGHLPSKVIIYGIEGKSFEIGKGLSEEVEGSAGVVTSRILDEIESMRNPHNQ